MLRPRNVTSMQQPANSHLLTAAGVASYLQVSLRKLDSLISRGEGPPHLRIGRQRRWKLEDVRAWVDTLSLHRLPEGRSACDCQTYQEVNARPE